MRIFVTGGSGFIGRAFCRLAAARGHRVLALCRDRDSPPGGPVEPAIGTIGSPPWHAIGNFEPDAAVHLAWMRNPGIQLNSSEHSRHIAPTAALFDELARRGVALLAGTGSANEYAPSPLPMAEDFPCHPTPSAYAAAKIRISQDLRRIAETAGIRWLWYRIFFAYGPGENSVRLLSSTIRILRAGEPALLRHPGSQRDFIHVEDVVSAMLLGLERGGSGIVNVGTGSGVRILDLAELIASIIGADKSLIQSEEPRSTDPSPVVVANPARLRALGWVPEIGLEEGLRRMVGAVA